MYMKNLIDNLLAWAYSCQTYCIMNQSNLKQSKTFFHFCQLVLFWIIGIVFHWDISDKWKNHQCCNFSVCRRKSIYLKFLTRNSVPILSLMKRNFVKLVSNFRDSVQIHQSGLQHWITYFFRFWNYKNLLMQSQTVKCQDISSYIVTQFFRFEIYWSFFNNQPSNRN